MDVDTQTHLKTLRDMLGYRLGELRAEVNAARMARQAREAQASAAEVADQKDQASQWAQAEVGDAEAQRDLDEMALVEQALQRMDAGTYGDCLQCGEPIPLARLYVQPAALRCAACQAAAEKGR
ncbi:MAG: TraR/DksA family transcriptional regulator [Pseudomonadota bacterium]